MAEEYYGIILNHMLGSQELKSDPNKSWLENVSDDIRKQALDITGGIALSTALLGGFGACAHLVSNAQFQLAKRSLAKAFGEPLANDIIRKTLFAKNSSIVNILNGYIESARQMSSTTNANSSKIDLDTKEKIDALQGYLYHWANLRGTMYYDNLVNFATKSKYAPYQRLAEQNGFSLASYEKKRDMEDVLDILRQ